jgi:prepilin-type processing-associated H-X9-DG protein
MRNRTQMPIVFKVNSDSGDSTAAESMAGRRHPAFRTLDRRSHRLTGLTLVELLVVIAIITMLAALLLPAFSRARGKTEEVVCLNNMKQLQTCAKLYSLDNDYFLPPNRNVYYVNTQGPSAGFDPNQTWCSGLAPFDTTTENIKRGLLFRYNKSTDIYRCPSDKSRVRTKEGKTLHLRRTRSYNMSQSINGLPYLGELVVLPSFAKETEIDGPSPSELLFFVDVHEDSILDSHFGIAPRGPTFAGEQPHWWDLPAGRHSQGCNLSFADGHVEHWRWTVPKIFIEPGQLVRQNGELQDFLRVQRGVKPETGF